MWFPIVERVILWVAFFASIITYIVKKRWYPVMYLISLALYVFTITFIMNVFNVSKDGILLLLAVSAILVIGAGFYISRRS